MANHAYCKRIRHRLPGITLRPDKHGSRPRHSRTLMKDGKWMLLPGEAVPEIAPAPETGKGYHH